MPEITALEYVTVKQFGEIAQLSKFAIYDRINKGELPAYKFGSGPRAPIRIKRADLDKVMIPVVPKGRK